MKITKKQHAQVTIESIRTMGSRDMGKMILNMVGEDLATYFGRYSAKMIQENPELAADALMMVGYIIGQAEEQMRAAILPPGALPVQATPTVDEVAAEARRLFERELRNKLKNVEPGKYFDVNGKDCSTCEAKDDCPALAGMMQDHPEGFRLDELEPEDEVFVQDNLLESFPGGKAKA